MDRNFLRFAAICAALLAVTTLLLWWLPQQIPEAKTFEDRLAIAANPYRVAQGWVGIAHMLLGFAAMLGVYFVVNPRSPGFAALGIAMFFAWMLVELVANSLGLFTVNATWRAGFASADAATQQGLRTLIAGWTGVYDALYFVLVVAFAVGSFAFAGIALGMTGFARVAGFFLLLGGILSVAYLVSSYGGPSWPETAANASYPFVQPVGRAILAVWLWRAARLPRLAGF